MNVRLALLACLVAAPAAAQTVDARVRQEAEGYLRICAQPVEADQRWCERSREEFVRDYLRARAGEYQGQRNVAFTLSGSAKLDLPSGGLMDFPANPNPIQSCAWRMIIVASASAQVDTSDTANMQRICTGLTPVGREAAHTRAQQIVELMRTQPVRNPPQRGSARPASTGPLDGTASPLTAGPPAQRPR